MRWRQHAAYPPAMKPTSALPNHSKRLATVFRANAPSGPAPPAPTVAEIAKGAYLNFVNQGSLPGHDVQHWLTAEAQLADDHRDHQVQIEVPEAAHAAGEDAGAPRG